MDFQMMPSKLQTFERAFAVGTSGCRRMCHCGKTYFHDEENGYDWEDGEFEKLLAGEAIGLDHSVNGVQFQGREYVAACDCWHAQASEMVKFIDRHARKIAEYLTLEKQRKQLEADDSPVVG